MRHMLRPHVGARPSTLSALAHWKLDEASGNAIDALGTYDLTENNTPGAAASLFAVPPGATGARTLDGSTEYFDATGAAAALAVFQGEFTVSAVFLNDTLSGVDTIFAYAGPTGVSADNAQFILSTSGDEIRVFWEYGASVNVSATTSGAGLADEPYLVVASVYFDTPTTRGVNVWIFNAGGSLVLAESFTGLTLADGGSNADFFIGQNGRSAEYWDGTLDDVVVWNQALTEDAAYMLSAETFGISYDEETLYDSGTESHHLRVRVANSAGELVDMTNIAHGQDVVVSADVSDDIDSPGAQASVSFIREIDGEDNAVGEGRWSLARDITVSPLNIVGGSFSPLLTLNRRILIDTAVIPEGDTPQEFDWVPLFEGYISAVDWGSDEVTVECTDKIGPLFDVFISKAPLEITAIDDTGTGNTLDITTSTPHGLSVGDIFKVYNTTNYNGSYTVRTVPSTTTLTTVEAVTGSPASESSGLLFPPDVATYGSSGGTPLETVIQDIIDGNAPPSVGYTGGTPTLYTPSSPSFDLLPYYQQREPVQTAIENLALMIGWTCKYRFDPEIRTHRLTLLEPDRAKTTPDYIFTNDEIIEFTQASIDSKDIRNVVELTFSDSNGTKDGAGQYPRITIRKEDATSIAAYGYRICQIAEASTSQIDTFTEASDLADAILSDLKDPKADIVMESPLRRFVQLGDLYRLPSNKYVWDTLKDVAVVGYAHSFSDGRASTTLTLRGQPAAANKGWTIRMVAPGFAPPQPTTPPLAPPAAPTLTALAGGVAIASPWPLDDLRGRNIDQMELHQSTTLNFIPNASTLRQATRSNRAELHNLNPAVTNFIRTRYRDRFGNYSPWSAQASIKPRYMLNVPCVHVHLSASQNIATPNTPTTVEFDDIALDTRGNFDDSTFSFTAPVDGVYSISCQLACDMLKNNENATVYIYEVGSPDVLLSTGSTSQGEDQTYIAHPSINVIYHLSQGTEILIKVAVTNANADVLDGAGGSVARSHLSINLVSQDDP